MSDLFTSAGIKADGFYKRPPPYLHSRLCLTMPSGVLEKINYKANNSLNTLFSESKSSEDRFPSRFKTKDLSIVDIADFIMEGFRSPVEP